MDICQQYMLIDSNYRDRYLYPNPADFIVPFQLINPQQKLSIITVTNPLCISYPSYIFGWNNVNSSTSFTSAAVFLATITGGTSNAPILDNSVDLLVGLNDKSPYVYTSTTNAFGLLKGLLFEVLMGGEPSIFREIIGYDPILRQVLLSSSIGIKEYVGRSCKIINMSNPSKIILQGSLEGLTGTVNLTRNVFLYDMTINEFRSATYIDTITNIIVLDKDSDTSCEATSTALCNNECGDGTPCPFSDAWKVTDTYMVIGNIPPLNLGVIVPFNGTTNRYVTSGSLYEFRMDTRGTGFMINDLVSFSVANKSVSDTALGVVTMIRGLGEIESLRLVFPGAGYNYGDRITLSLLSVRQGNVSGSATISKVGSAFHCQLKQRWSGELTGNFFLPMIMTQAFSIRPTSNTDVTPTLKLSNYNTIPGKPTRFINNFDNYTASVYNGAYAILAVIPSYDATTQRYSETDVYLITTILPPEYTERFDAYDVSNPATIGALNFLILRFDGESVVPLNFTGSYLTQTQATCYELMVNTLILPNAIIDMSDGCLTSSFPYVFLEVSNETSSSGHNRSVLYSNNPSAVFVTFVCSISDVNNPLTTKFIKINSDGAGQIMKFKPTDNLHIRITLPNGQVFRTKTEDFVPPVAPDPRLQIHVVLSLKRLP